MVIYRGDNVCHTEIIMRLTYQTGIAALVHLGVITVFNVLNGITSSARQCSANSSGCVGDIVVAMIYFMLITMWFTAVWILAAAAQERRGRKLAFILIGCEFLIFSVALFNARSNSGLEFVTSIVNALLAAWVGILAIRLFIHGGGRVTSSGRARRRRLSKAD